MWYTFRIHFVYFSCIHLVQFFYTECIHSFHVGSLYVPAKFRETARFMSIDPQLVQVYQIIHIHPVTIFNNDTFAETIPS